MSFKINNLDLYQSAIQTEYRIAVLERVVDHLLKYNPAAASALSMEMIRTQVLADLQRKYPNADIYLEPRPLLGGRFS